MKNAKCKRVLAFCLCILNFAFELLLIRVPHERIVSREWPTEIDVSCDRVRFLAVHQDLHAADGWEVGGDRVDDRVDGEQLDSAIRQGVR